MEEQKCPICLESWSSTGEHRLCSLRCGHLFGYKCIQHWFKIKNANSRRCPECNSVAKEKDIRILYAKNIMCVDSQKIDELESEMEKKSKNWQAQEKNYSNEIENLQLERSNLEEMIKSLIQEKNPISITSNNKFVMKKDKIFNICDHNSCRVMVYNPWHKMLIVSSGIAINKICMDSNYTFSTFNLHNANIRDFCFQEVHPNILLSCAFDRKVMLMDVRNNQTTHSYQGETKLWSCCWSNHNDQMFFVGTAKGSVVEYDIRYLQTEVSISENTEDRCPVISLASVPTTSPTVRSDGYLACQLNSCSIYCFENGNYVGNRIDIKGPFTSLRYDEKKNYVLLSCRNNRENPRIRHTVCFMVKQNNNINFIPIHTFDAGHKQSILSKPCFINFENDTIVVAHNESISSIVGWNMTSGKEVYKIPIAELAYDISSFVNDNQLYQAVLTAKKTYLFRHEKNQNVVTSL